MGQIRKLAGPTMTIVMLHNTAARSRLYQVYLAATQSCLVKTPTLAVLELQNRRQQYAYCSRFSRCRHSACGNTQLRS